MASAPTSSDPSPSLPPAIPDNTQNLAAQHTGDSTGPAPTPGGSPILGIVKETAAIAPNPEPQGPQIMPPPNDPATPATSSAQSAQSFQAPVADANKQGTIDGAPVHEKDQSPPTYPKQTGMGTDGSVAQDSDPISPSNSKKIPADLHSSKDPTQTHGFTAEYDPSNASPDQISQIENALQTPTASAQNGPDQQNSPQEDAPASDNTEQRKESPSETPVQSVFQQQNYSPSYPNNSEQPDNGSSGAPALNQPNRQSNPPAPTSSPTASALPNNGFPEGSEQFAPEQQNYSSGDAPTLGLPVAPSKIPSAPPATTLSIASHAIVVGPYDVHIDGSKIEPHGAPITIPGAVAVNHGNSIVLGSQVYQMPSATPAPATTIAGQAITPVVNGAVLNGATIAVGSSAVLVSGIPVSVDLSSHIKFGSSIYQLPSANPVPTTTIPNGATAIILPHAVSIHGTTLSAGGPAATNSGTRVSLDTSNNLIYGATAVVLPSTTPLPSTPSLATSSGTPVSVITAGGSVQGSSTVRIESLSRSGLGGIIMGGPGSAGGSSTATAVTSGSLPTPLGNGSMTTGASSTQAFTAGAGCLSRWVELRMKFLVMIPTIVMVWKLA
jgi:hypothetical protein